MELRLSCLVSTPAFIQFCMLSVPVGFNLPAMMSARGTAPLSMQILVAAALQKFGKTPLLMDDEMEAQYKMVYNRAMARNDASAEINLVSTRLASLACSPLRPRHLASRYPLHTYVLRLSLLQ